MTDYLLITRDTRIAAPADQVVAQLQDFRNWQHWSPWEGLDPNLQRSYSGPAAGAGAHYAWSGNKKAGQGEMTVVSATPEQIDVDLRFIKPFKSASKVRFALAEADDETQLTWEMRTPKSLMFSIMNKVMKMDQAIGRDIETGLANLKAYLEA